MRRIAIVVLAGIMITGVATAVDDLAEHRWHGKHEEPEVKIIPQTTCPVMGGKINKKHYADIKGKRIYVCCPGCIGKIQADPEKFLENLEKEGVTLDATPKPPKGGDRHTEHKGHNH